VPALSRKFHVHPIIALPDLHTHETRFRQLSHSLLPLSGTHAVRRIDMCSRSRAKSRDDIMALMHVTYTGDDALDYTRDDALPLQQATAL